MIDLLFIFFAAFAGAFLGGIIARVVYERWKLKQWKKQW